MQRAIDRSFLIETHGEVWKHARLKKVEYAQTEFLAEYPREGGIHLGAVRQGANAIVDRLANAIRPVFESSLNQGLQEHASIAAQLLQRREFVSGAGETARTFADVASNPPPTWASAYSNRSVVKEIDQIVNQITPSRLDGSSVDISLHGERAHLPFQFTPAIAKRFHRIAANRELGPPMIVRAKIRSLDEGNRQTKPSAKILNLDSRREVILHLAGNADFLRLHPYHTYPEVRLFACPIFEALGFDLNGGDLMFIAMAV